MKTLTSSSGRPGSQISRAYGRDVNSDDYHGCLHRSGWTIGDVALQGPGKLLWLVTGHNGENLIRAEGATRDEAWLRACEQAEAVGMLRRDGGPSEVRSSRH